MTTFVLFVTICNGISVIIGLCMIFVRPIRERVFELKSIRDGQKCMLRSDMLSTYYRNMDTETIRQYEKENFVLEYKAYKAMGGNSFIDDIYENVRRWEVRT